MWLERPRAKPMTSDTSPWLGKANQLINQPTIHNQCRTLARNAFQANSKNTNKTKYHANGTGNLKATLVKPMWQGMVRPQDAKKLHPSPLSASSTQARLKQASEIQRDVHLRVLGAIKRHFENLSESTGRDMRHQHTLHRATGNVLRAYAMEQHPSRIARKGDPAERDNSWITASSGKALKRWAPEVTTYKASRFCSN